MSKESKKRTDKEPDVIVAEPSDEGRLDRVLALRYPDWSRTGLQKLINTRKVTVDAHPASPHDKIRKGQTIRIEWPGEPEKRAPRLSKDLPFPVLYEDDDIFAIDKPAGLVVHPAAGHHGGDTLVELVEAKLEKGPWPDEMRPGLVHRLDRDTSGVIIMAKTPEAHRKLSLQFSRRQTKKTYLALTKGIIEKDEGVLESHLARDPGKRQRFAVSGVKGRWSSTKFKVLERITGRATLVEMTPLTGRTHQIRVHLSHFGHPILGDHVYGLQEKEFAFVKRHLLHAHALQLKHPTTGKEMTFESPLPSDFQEALKLIRSAS